ncbi:hypothetical protein BJ508DRAFT_364572 [Ascobolus immersus RN42]|uniref:Uncharacterized protein n=1 Tax=Ascobolus immersus RN42 TaxID=1160509 RepID=A0A3N4HUA3_ASCIM|nr:hypothetical protein BJ508DRAFT_364572 [Ascobolus immersus RN42]
MHCLSLLTTSSALPILAILVALTALIVIASKTSRTWKASEVRLDPGMAKILEEGAGDRKDPVEGQSLLEKEHEEHDGREGGAERASLRVGGFGMFVDED